MYKFFFELKSIINILIILLFLQSLFYCSFDQARMHIYTYTHIHKISGFFFFFFSYVYVLSWFWDTIYQFLRLFTWRHIWSLSTIYFPISVTLHYLEQNIHFSPHYFSPIILNFSLDNYNNLTDVFVAYFSINILS